MMMMMLVVVVVVVGVVAVKCGGRESCCWRWVRCAVKAQLGGPSQPSQFSTADVDDRKKKKRRAGVIRHAPRCAAGLHTRELPNRVAEPIKLAPDED